MIPIQKIQSTIKEARPDNSRGQLVNEKMRAVNLYEELEAVQTIDTAYPMQWSQAVRQHFHISNIGLWCWWYDKGSAFGKPLPCCSRSLVLLELLLADPDDNAAGLIYKPNYQEEAERVTS